jgi:hypothetical protein
VDTQTWVSGTKHAWSVAADLDDLRHFRLMNGRHLKAVLRRDPFERRIGALIQQRLPRALLLKASGKQKKKIGV